MTGRRATVLAAALVVLAAPLFGAGAASATSSTPSNWWYDRYGVAEAHDAGWTGKGVKIAVIENQINARLPVFSDADLTVDPEPLCKGGTVGSTVADKDTVHGADVTAMLVGNGRGTGGVHGIAPDATVRVYVSGTPFCATDARPDSQASVALGIQRAVDDGAKIISLSVGTTTMNPGSIRAVADALARGVIVVSAEPNGRSGADARSGYPTTLNGVVAVNAIDANGLLQKDHEHPAQQDVWPETTVVAAGVDFPSVDWKERGSVTGSSLATPLVAGMLADTWQKYPDATANQLIQSLIRNTGAKDHALTYQTDGIGYGGASLRHLLAVNPTKYDDVNPLMTKKSGMPTKAQVEAAAEPTAKPTATATAGAAVAATGVSATPFVFGAVGLIVVIVALVVVTIVLVRRSRRAKEEEHA